MKRLRLVVVISLLLALLGTQTAWASPHKKCYSCKHVVKRCENLTKIARKYGTTVKAIVRANGIRNAHWIYPGQRLVIPSCKKKACDGKKVYRVRRGDTLSKIAQRYCVRVKDLVRRNHIRNRNLIYRGQKLVIPKARCWCDP